MLRDCEARIVGNHAAGQDAQSVLHVHLSRPGEKVTDEVSIIIGYPFKPNSEATVAVGTASFALYTQQDGAWIKNAAEEAHLIEAMRSGENAVIKGTSAKGTRSTDTFSLKGLAEALDRSDKDCK